MGNTFSNQDWRKIALILPRIAGISTRNDAVKDEWRKIAIALTTVNESNGLITTVTSG